MEGNPLLIHEEIGSAIGTTEHGTVVQTDREWIQSIGLFTYKAESDYFMDQVNKMWMQEEPFSTIDALMMSNGAVLVKNISKKLNC
jgi:hypothetical protein